MHEPARADGAGCPVRTPACRASAGTLVVRVASPGEQGAERLIRAYMRDIVSRWWGRPAGVDEIDRAIADEPATGLEPPSGHFAVAVLDGREVGMGGVLLREDGIAELTKIFTAPAARGRGVASALLTHLERVALDSGRCIVRLDTRSDLVEACRLYEQRGYRRVPAFGESEYSDRWYQRQLDVDA